jgi:hypothetical protein
MTTNSKQEALRRAVVELIELEGTLERTLGARVAEAGGAAEVGEALRRLGSVAVEHRTALEAYLVSLGGSAGGRADPANAGAAVPGRQGAPGTSAALAEAFGVLNEAAFRYSVLTTMAFRLYELPLRELAPKHLRDYAEAAQAINQLIPPTVAGELRDRGLECECTCPMCSLGACGCVVASTRQINAGWREAAPPAEGAPGLLLQPPRTDSDLARAGFRGGELLLAVDDRPIREFRDLIDVQAAIRDHAPGEDLRLRVQRGSEEPAEVRVSRGGASPV